LSAFHVTRFTTLRSQEIEHRPPDSGVDERPELALVRIKPLGRLDHRHHADLRQILPFNPTGEFSGEQASNQPYFS
jgi:hypothetical protein